MGQGALAILTCPVASRWGERNTPETSTIVAERNSGLQHLAHPHGECHAGLEYAARYSRTHPVNLD